LAKTHGAVIGPGIGDAVEPAGGVVLERAGAGVAVSLVFVMHQRMHLAAVVGPGGGDPAVVAIVRRIGIVGAVENEPAVGALRLAVDHGEQAVIEVGRGQAGVALVVAEGAGRRIGNVVVVAAV